LARKGHSEEEILRVLRGAESGETVVEICRKHGISQQSFYLWKKKYAGLGLSELRELRQLREENGKLKRLVAYSEFGSAHPAGDRRKKALKPRMRRELAEWAQQAHDLSQRRAASARVGRQPGSLWLSPSDGDVEARRLGRLAANWLSGCTITTTTGHTRRLPTERLRNLRPYAAVENSGDKAALENASRFRHFHRTAAADSDMTLRFGLKPLAGDRHLH